MLQIDTDTDFTSCENEGFFEIKNITKTNPIIEGNDSSNKDIVSTNKDSLITQNHLTDNTISTPTEGYLFNENYVHEEDVLSPKQDPLFCQNKSEKTNSLQEEIISSKEQQALDLDTYLQHLREMFNNKQQYMMEMIEILLLQIPEASQKMKVAIASENWDEVFFQSHRIKSTFKIVGLHELVNVCMAIEGRTRIIAPEELHLVPDFFKKFQLLSKIEVPNLEKAFAYLKNRCEQERSKLPTEDSDSTFLL
ncbi:MAG: Hpt domain-containing protein [Chitinophagales bacterium]